jgi:hypothetical protein
MATLTKFQSWLRPNKTAPYASSSQPSHPNLYGFVFSTDIRDWQTSYQMRLKASYKNAKPLF